MSKAARQSLLLRIVRERSPRTQEEVASLLASRGVEVSQVTLSRDLRELGVVKAPEGYREPQATPRPPEEALLRTLREFVTAVETAQNLVVVKTNPGGRLPSPLASTALAGRRSSARWRATTPSSPPRRARAAPGAWPTACVTLSSTGSAWMG
ncbi:MAG: hypothetical protein R2748_09720 [Bryobacterales bacterium]